MLTTALETAHKQDLVEFTQARKGRRTWQATNAARAEARADREWAHALISELEKDVRARLEVEYPTDSDVLRRAPRLTKTLIGSMVTATGGVFDAVRHSASPNDLREVRLNLRSVVPELRRTIKPTELAEFMANLVLSAASPEEDFGNELLRALVAGQILHGMVCRDDVAVPPPVSKLVLDTSQLLALASNEHSKVQLFQDFLETASSHGCALVVTDRVVDEWTNHWQLAEEQESKLRVRYGSSAPHIMTIANQATVAAFGFAAAEDDRLTFVEWARNRRNLQAVLNQHGIGVVDTTAANLDWSFVRNFSAAIEQSVSNKTRQNPRGPNRRETDGISAALVQAYRSEHADTLVPAAWFVAADRLSDEAYREITGDDFPLTITARTWLLYYSAFDPVDAPSRVELAERISEDIILEAFLGVAAAYTTDEMLELGDLLSADDIFDEKDVREAVKNSFLHPEVHASAKDLARARIQRQSKRALRSQEVQSERERESQSKLNVAQQRIKDLEDAARGNHVGRTRQRRITEVVIIVALALLLLVLGTTLHLIHGGWLIIAWSAFVLAVPTEAVRYVRNSDARLRFLVAESCGAFGLLVLGLIIDRQFSK